jgi:hypothetical protein
MKKTKYKYRYFSYLVPSGLSLHLKSHLATYHYLRGKTWKEAHMVCFNALSQHITGGTDEVLESLVRYSWLLVRCPPEFSGSISDTGYPD